MAGLAHGHVARVLLVLVAVLLPAGVLGVIRGDGQAPVRVESLGSAALGVAGIGEETTTVPARGAPVSSTAVTVTPPVPATTTFATRATSTTASPPATRGPATSPAPPSTAPATTSTTVPRTSSWSASQNGIGLRMRMEPAAPQAGEPVTFFVELSPIDACCIGGLSFGDETGAPLAFEARCTYSPGTVQKATTVHSFLAAGAYKVVASAATVPCSLPAPGGDGALTPTGFPLGVSLEACVVIGAAKADCLP